MSSVFPSECTPAASPRLPGSRDQLVKLVAVQYGYQRTWFNDSTPSWADDGHRDRAPDISLSSGVCACACVRACVRVRARARACDLGSLCHVFVSLTSPSRRGRSPSHYPLITLSLPSHYPLVRGGSPLLADEPSHALGDRLHGALPCLPLTRLQGPAEAQVRFLGAGGLVSGRQLS